jgi:hypothetical protein
MRPKELYKESELDLDKLWETVQRKPPGVILSPPKVKSAASTRRRKLFSRVA